METRVALRPFFAVLVILKIGTETELTALVAIAGFWDAVAAARLADQLTHQLVSGLHLENTRMEIRR